MANRQQRVRMIMIAYYVIGVGAVVAVIASHAHSWRDRLTYAAFLLGFGGMAYLFQQWRRAGNLSARNWLVAALGSWMVAVFAGAASATSGFLISCLGLAIGFAGAATVLLRRKAEIQG